MSDEFVETGQTFTNEGAAYCPIERKRRGPAAMAISIAVMAVGAGFLTYAVMSAPARIAPSPATADLSANTPERVVIAVDPAPSTASESAAPLGATSAVTIDEALAESRAARAGAVQEPFKPTLAPRLKPGLGGSAGDGVIVTELAPRLKPQTAAAPAAPAALTRARPANMNGVLMASAEDGPPPFFFRSDMERTKAPANAAPVVYAGDLAQDLSETVVRINKGETFVDALKRAGIAAGDRNLAAYAFGEHYNLRQLRPGQEFRMTLGWPNQTLFQLASASETPDARLIALDFRADYENRVVVRRNGGSGFVSEKHVVPLTTQLLAVSGRINGSLYLSAKAEGAPDQIIADLADAFAYDVDFQREIFGGDEFEAIFEARYDDQGVLVSTGDILYARLHWRGRSKEKGYYRFAEDGERGDFYDATGQSAKRLLMKTPIDGARLSSTFGTRKHPILGYRRAHKGLDFAAPRGTPIKAAGDGVVERANRYGSFGNYIKIRHANGYETAYAHLNGFGRGVRKGKRVRQGDIIGYVGTTGRSTGPHLHYEVHLRGTAVNPQRLKIATGKQLKGDALDRFKVQRDMIEAMRLPPPEDSPLYAREDTAAAGSL